MSTAPGTRSADVDAVVVGSGPNGLCAAIEIARAGRSVVVYESRQTVGGGVRTAELTLPGFRHDRCSAIHPMAVGSPFLSTLPLAEHGLEWVHPEAPLAHPLDDGPAVLLERSVDETADLLGADGAAYQRLMTPFVEGWDALSKDAMGRPFAIPQRPFLLARFGVRGFRSALGLARSAFRQPRAQALLAGLAGHSVLPLERSPSAAIGLMLGFAGHAVGWPFPRGGAAALSDALASYLRSLGGEIHTGRRIESVDELPERAVVFFDTSPQAMVALAGDQLPASFGTRLRRFRHGPGVFKLDWALDGPIPWRDQACARAGTVHLGGTLEAIAASERAVWRGEISDDPYVLVAQQSLFDGERAPPGQHTGWAYCHVPPSSTVDLTALIERQMERYAPGFRDRILARHAMNTADFEAHNENYIGGDINGGVPDLDQLFSRPVWRLNPYGTPNKRFFLCSASTPPGGGVHGMCGVLAARSALARWP